MTLSIRGRLLLFFVFIPLTPFAGHLLAKFIGLKEYTFKTIFNLFIHFDFDFNDKGMWLFLAFAEVVMIYSECVRWPNKQRESENR